MEIRFDNHRDIGAFQKSNFFGSGLAGLGWVLSDGAAPSPRSGFVQHQGRNQQDLCFFQDGALGDFPDGQFSAEIRQLEPGSAEDRANDWLPQRMMVRKDGNSDLGLICPLPGFRGKDLGHGLLADLPAQI